jgi:hypothetical protein
MREKIALRVFSAVLTAGLLLAATAPAMAAGTAAGFRDVPAGSAYAEAVTYVGGRGLMKGTSATAFSPSGTLTRAMFVTILAREVGVNTDSYLNDSFRDVKSGSWCSGAVAWAYQYGITNGYSANVFGVNQPVTREQTAAIIARTVKQFHVALTTAQGTAFADAGKASAYAKDGLELMRQTGIMSADQTGNFNPKAKMTRGETAQTFMRLDQAVKAVTEAANKSARIISAAGAPCTVTERVLLRDFRNDLRYPEISGLASAEHQQAWNAVFQKNAAAEKKALTDEGSVITDTFAVTQADAKLLSVTEDSYAYADGGMHGTASRFSWNFDMVTGKQVKLSDLCDTDAIAKAIVSGKGYEIITAWGETAKPDELNLDNILMMCDCKKTQSAVKAMLDRFDSTDPSQLAGYTYWVNGKPCLVFSVSHAAGDYCVIQMDASYGKNA